MGVFARQNLAGISDEVTHDVGRREWNLVRCQRLGGGLGGAHIDKRMGEAYPGAGVVNGTFFDGNGRGLGGLSMRSSSVPVAQMDRASVS